MTHLLSGLSLHIRPPTPLLENPVLNGVYRLGSVSELLSGSVEASISENSANLISGRSSAELEHLTGTGSCIRAPGLAPKLLTRALSGGGQIFDALTGTLSLAEGFKQDVDQKCVGFPNTLNAAVRSTFQIGSAGLMISAVGGATVFGIPFIAAGAAAVGAAAAAGYVYDSMREWLL